MLLALLLIASTPQMSAPDVAPACGAELDLCRSLLLQHSSQAADCLRAFIQSCPDSPNVEQAQAFLELASTLNNDTPVEPTRDLDVPAPATRPGPSPQATAKPKRLSLSETMLGGGPELVLTSTLFGAAQGFLATAALVSALRSSESTSFPALVTMPAIGAAAGLGAALLANRNLNLDVGDRALLSSAMSLGTIYGVVIQGLWEWSEQDHRRQQVQRVPQRFGLVLSSSLLVAGGAAAAAWGTHIDPGDVGLANSGALWGAIIGGLGMLTLSDFSPSRTASVLVPLAASVLSYNLLLSLSPLISVQRPATWLIEAGGALGLALALGMTPILNVAGMPPQAIAATFTATAALGVTAGAGACFLVDRAFERGSLNLPNVFERTALVPSPLQDRDGRLAGLGLGLVGHF